MYIVKIFLCISWQLTSMEIPTPKCPSEWKVTNVILENVFEKNFLVYVYYQKLSFFLIRKGYDQGGVTKTVGGSWLVFWTLNLFERENY